MTDETGRSFLVLLDPGKRGFPAATPFILVVFSSWDVVLSALVFWFKVWCGELEAFEDWLINEFFAAETSLFGGVETETPSLDFFGPILDTWGEVTAAGRFLSDEVDTAEDVLS